VKDATSQFHVYRADWTPDKIEMFVDNKKYFTYINTEKLMTPGHLISRFI
jgi:beta-glucanase (GH16 family)